MFSTTSKPLLLLLQLLAVTNVTSGQTDSTDLLGNCDPAHNCRQPPKCECLSGNINDLSVLKTLPHFNWTTIDISFNQITSIRAADFFGISFSDSIKELYLENDGISSIDNNSFTHLKHLEELSLRNNNLTNISTNAFDIISLKRLNLLNCHLTNLHETIFDKLINLEYIDLSDNQIYQIEPKLFQSLVNVREINLKSNSLKILDKDTFHGLSKLEWIDLSNNKIKHLPNGLFKSLNQLEYVNMNKNSLTVLEMYTVTELFDKKNPILSDNLEITGNQWDCDNCTLLEVLKWCQNKTCENVSNICANSSSSWNVSFVNNHKCFLQTTVTESLEITTIMNEVTTIEQTFTEELEQYTNTPVPIPKTPEPKPETPEPKPETPEPKPETPEPTNDNTENDTVTMKTSFLKIGNNNKDRPTNNNCSNVNVSNETDSPCVLQTVLPNGEVELLGTMCVYQYYLLGSYAMFVLIVACTVSVIIYRVKLSEDFEDHPHYK